MKNIVFWGSVVYKWMRRPFLEEIKKGEGASIHFICTTPQDIEYWKKEGCENLIDTFITVGGFFHEYDQCSDPVEEIYKKARDYESKYGMYIVDALQADRHLGRGFSAAGIGHPKSELSDKADYVKSVNLFNKLIEFWEEYFDKTRPDLVIGVSSGIIGKALLAVMHHRGIPLRLIVSARYKSHYYWAFDEYYSSPEIKRYFESISNVKEFVDDKELEDAIHSADVSKAYKHFIQIRSPFALSKRILSQIKRQIYRRYNNIVSMGNYKPMENIKYLCRVHNEAKAMERFKAIDAEYLSSKSYVFFPLHCEPEAALGALSPEFNEQMALIEFIAKNLPAGTVLAVKEHIFAIGRRPRDFYSTLLQIPNVVMVSPYAYALDIAKKARCVAVITSSLGTEAVIMGVPVIAFGIHNNFSFLPHAYVVESWKELRPLLAKLCSDDMMKTAEQRKQDGKRYLAALKASSMNFEKCLIIDRRIKSEDITEKDASGLYLALKKSLSA